MTEWGATEWGLFTFNVIAVSIIIWALRYKIVSKLAEVEERQNRSTERRRMTLVSKEEQDANSLNEDL